MKRLLLKVNILDDFADNNGCDKAMLELDDTMRSYLLGLRKQCQGLFDRDSFYAASFFDYSLTAVSANDLMDLDWFDDDAAYIVAPGGVTIESASEFRMDAPTLRITKSGIMWSFYAKHSDITFETGRVDWSVIEAAA